MIKFLASTPTLTVGQGRRDANVFYCEPPVRNSGALRYRNRPGRVFTMDPRQVEVQERRAMRRCRSTPGPDTTRGELYTSLSGRCAATTEPPSGAANPDRPWLPMVCPPRSTTPRQFRRCFRIMPRVRPRRPALRHAAALRLSDGYPRHTALTPANRPFSVTPFCPRCV